jgi:hypothetical protein
VRLNDSGRYSASFVIEHRGRYETLVFDLFIAGYFNVSKRANYWDLAPLWFKGATNKSDEVYAACDQGQPR